MAEEIKANLEAESEGKNHMSGAKKGRQGCLSASETSLGGRGGSLYTEYYSHLSGQNTVLQSLPQLLQGLILDLAHSFLGHADDFAYLL